MEGWLMSETRHGISWQKGIFADKFFRGPVERWEKLSKIPSFFLSFFLFYFISLLRRGIFIPSSPRRLDDSHDISWWKDSQLKSLRMVQRIHVGERMKFRLILTRNEARLCYRSDGGGER